MRSAAASRFNGDLVFYEELPQNPDRICDFEWGSFYISNPRRNERPRFNASDGSQRSPCPFCVGGKHFESGHPLVHFVFHDHEYLLTPNAFPILSGHSLILPTEHRVTLSADDFLLACQLPSQLSSLVRPDGRLGDLNGVAGWCVYLNTRGAGQTVEHLHWQIVPADRIPLPLVTAGKEIAANDCCSVHQVTGLSFYALTVQAATTQHTSHLLQRLDLLFKATQLPYNLVLFEDRHTAPRSMKALIVPRSSVFAAEVNTHIAGFEILSGVLIPVEAPLVPLTSAARDRAFLEVTLPRNRIEALESSLRSMLLEPC